MKTPASRTTWGGLALACLLAIAGGCSDQEGAGGAEGAGGEGSKDPFGGGGGDDKLGLLDNATIEVSPKALSFSGQFATETKKVTVTNSGDKGGLTLKSVRLSDTTSPSFSLTQPERMALGPLDGTEFTVTYTKSLTGNDTGAVIIEHDGKGAGPVTVPLKTDSTGGAMKVSPSLVKFNDVPISSSATKSVSVTNVGSAPFQVTGIAMVEGTSAPDFTVAPKATLPVVLAASATHIFEVTYTPDGEGDDVGQVRISTDLSSQSEEVVPVTGNVTGPKLVVVPGIVNFGVIPIGTSKPIEVTLQNVGSADLTLDSVSITFGTSPFVTVQGVPTAPVVLAPAESTSFEAIFAPTEAFPYTLDPLGGISVVSNDPGTPQLVAPVFGNVGAPSIQVNPVYVDFGLVAKDDIVFREVSILNAGKHVLDVSSIAFQSDSNGEFKLVDYDIAGWSTPGVLQEDERVIMRLSFTNTTLSTADASGLIVIESTDPQQPKINVELTAKRAGQKECKPEIIPAALNYGIVPYGNTKTMPVTIKNNGSGPCSFKKAKTFNCGTGFFGLPGACTDGIGGQASNFKIVGQPPAIPAGIPQGGKVTVQVMFVPPSDAPLIEFFNTYSGAFQVEVTDPSNGDALIQMPAAAQPSALPVNLQAQSGISDISVIPSQVDFGLVTIGCTSEETRVTIYNNGNAPLVITDLVLEGCTPEFKITQMPPIPPGGLEVWQNNPVDVWVLYTPQQKGKSYCTLAVVSDDSDQSLLTVPLQGEGTYESEWTDVFTQLSGKQVDVLFVVDNSGSMGDEQKNLSDNFGSFIQEAKTWNTDFHLGVITTDAQGKDHAGKLQGNPRIITPATADTFKQTVKVGTNGNGTEQGLEAAHLALSLPLAYTSNKSCGADADCTAPSTCVQGLCGGWNGGFLRSDATLEVVFVSDEEDQSPAPLTFYIDFLKSIKGFANESLMHAHAIVGPEPKGCGGDPNDANAGADAGKRYIEVANQTGGKVGSICDKSFSAVLSGIGSVAFGLKQQFFLTAKADPPTVKVWVSGVACNSGWKFDPPSNSVIFDLNGACMPQEGEEVKIYYKMLCLHEG
ncbi:MAG: hypothetical protein AMXMBFR64_52040 [Myxococcales bacterium]